MDKRVETRGEDDRYENGDEMKVEKVNIVKDMGWR